MLPKRDARQQGRLATHPKNLRVHARASDGAADDTEACENLLPCANAAPTFQGVRTPPAQVT
jgi:hypothetical protein